MRYQIKFVLALYPVKLSSTLNIRYKIIMIKNDRRRVTQFYSNIITHLANCKAIKKSIFLTYT